MWTEDDTYDRLMEQEVSGVFSPTTFTTNNQRVLFYRYELDGVEKSYCIGEAQLPDHVRGRQHATGWASPSGHVRFL